MARTRAFRHHQEHRAKARAKAVLLGRGETPAARRIGRTAHAPQACSGPCCGNPRRWYGERTVQERRLTPCDTTDLDTDRGRVW